MRLFTISFAASAEQDLLVEYDWGCRYWGVTQARKWARDLRTAINTLKTFPEGRPLAPENGQFPYDVRHLIFQRYRVLYIVIESTVYVLHIRGAYVDDEASE